MRHSRPALHPGSSALELFASTVQQNASRVPVVKFLSVLSSQASQQVSDIPAFAFDGMTHEVRFGTAGGAERWLREQKKWAVHAL